MQHAALWNIHLNIYHCSCISLMHETKQQIQEIFMLPLSAFTCATVMKMKCMHTSDKYREINKNKVSKPNERLFIIGLVMSLAPSARSFPPISPSIRGSYRRHSNRELCHCRVDRLPFTVSSASSDGEREKEKHKSFNDLWPLCGQRNCEIMHP